mmetsp:Transcript_48592/g.136697  ORF Transcript_48592/g.136697 Transcript_48592/m.136697 type:complete len:221 (-) Transcript_48592:211-873(-)
MPVTTPSEPARTVVPLATRMSRRAVTWSATLGAFTTSSLRMSVAGNCGKAGKSARKSGVVPSAGRTVVMYPAVPSGTPFCKSFTASTRSSTCSWSGGGRIEDAEISAMACTSSPGRSAFTSCRLLTFDPCNLGSPFQFTTTQLGSSASMAATRPKAPSATEPEGRKLMAWEAWTRSPSRKAPESQSNSAPAALSNSGGPGSLIKSARTRAQKTAKLPRHR